MVNHDQGSILIPSVLKRFLIYICMYDSRSIDSYQSFLIYLNSLLKQFRIKSASYPNFPRLFKYILKFDAFQQIP